MISSSVRSTDLNMESTRANNNATLSIDIYTTGWETPEAMTKDTFMEEVESYTIFKVANFISIYWFPVLIPIGLVGNTLSFLVMIKPNNKKMSTCIYMAAISVNDNTMMFICSHDYLVSVVQIHKWYSIECKISALIFLFALQNETFQVLSMTLDKYIANKVASQSSCAQYTKESQNDNSGFVHFYICLQYPPSFSFRDDW